MACPHSHLTCTAHVLKHTNTPFTPLTSLNLPQFILHTSFLPPTPSFRFHLLPLLSTDQSSACSVSISHVSFLLASPSLNWGQGLPSSHFPSLPEHGCSGWPYLLSLLSQPLTGSPHHLSATLVSLASLFLYSTHTDRCTWNTHTYRCAPVGVLCFLKMELCHKVVDMSRFILVSELLL